ncbi:hypothetical protein BDZ91DRAFT_766569 [Kalaharituber pfeilii]|nr:hypothetical protein BDZ91DRAFT_766569 [Kalaharituber pfeilii]
MSLGTGTEPCHLVLFLLLLGLASSSASSPGAELMPFPPVEKLLNPDSPPKTFWLELILWSLFSTCTLPDCRYCHLDNADNIFLRNDTGNLAINDTPPDAHHVKPQGTTSTGSGLGVLATRGDFQQSIHHRTSMNYNRILESPGQYETDLAIQERQPNQAYRHGPRFESMHIPSFSPVGTYFYASSLDSLQNYMLPTAPYIEVPFQEDQGSSTVKINAPSREQCIILSDSHPAPAEQHQERQPQSHRKDSWFKCRFKSCRNRNAERSDNFRNHLKMNHAKELRNGLKVEPDKIPSGMRLTKIINSFKRGDARLWRLRRRRILGFAVLEKFLGAIESDKLEGTTGAGRTGTSGICLQLQGSDNNSGIRFAFDLFSCSSTTCFWHHGHVLNSSKATTDSDRMYGHGIREVIHPARCYIIKTN